MDAAALVTARLRSHRLSAPARTVGEAASHMLATQAQEFWGGRWAIASRTRRALTLSDVDRAFDSGELVRSWTMRGTIHIIPARDLAWVLSVTGERQLRQGAARLRDLELDADALSRAERIARDTLRGGNRVTRSELFAVLEAGGLSTAGQRGVHLLWTLSLRGVVVQGPIVARAGAATREQFIVLSEEWIREDSAPDDPLTELFVRYIEGHGPASAADFAWWSGLPLGRARAAAEAAGIRVSRVDDDAGPLFVARDAPRRAPVPAVRALAPFEEYYLSYADRSRVCDPPFVDVVGPGRNGIVRPIIVVHGRVVGVWRHSVAVGRHADDPLPELFEADAATPAEVATALARYRDFITG